jgi:hypothetical protein
MNFGDLLFLASPLAITAVGLFMRWHPVRWFLIGLGLIFFAGLCWHGWSVRGVSNPLNSDTVLIVFAYAFGAPVLLTLALILELLHRKGWFGGTRT